MKSALCKFVDIPEEGAETVRLFSRPHALRLPTRTEGDAVFYVWGPA